MGRYPIGLLWSFFKVVVVSLDHGNMGIDSIRHPHQAAMPCGARYRQTRFRLTAILKFKMAAMAEVASYISDVVIMSLNH